MTVLTRLVVVSTLLLAPPTALADRPSDHRRAARLLGDWQYAEARALIGALHKKTPNAAQTRYLRAEMAFLDGDYSLSIQLLSEIKNKKLVRRAKRLRELVESTLEATRGFAKSLSPKGHFEIHYDPGKDEVLVELAAEALDSAYEALATDFGIRPDGPIRVEMLRRPDDLAKTSTLTVKDIRTTGTIALCKYNKLMAVSPRATMFGYAWLDTLVHEYVHYVVSVKSRDRVPVWLHEGLARFEQARWREKPGGALSGTDEHLLARALRKNEFISWKEMHPSMAKLPSQAAAALAYAEVLTMVEYIHKRKGYRGLRAVLDRVRGGEDATDAVAAVMEISWRRVEQGWRGHLRAANLTSKSELAGRAKKSRLRFRAGGEKSENVGLDEIRSKKARRFARLGGMLRARGMTRAAALEYEKALAVAGPRDPLIAAKLSRTYLELKKYQRAIELAEPLVNTDNHDAAPPTTLGIAYLATGIPEKAVAAFEQAVRINPFDPRVRCGLADAYSELDRKKVTTRERRACEILRR